MRGIRCPVRATTGLACPGCGGTRAVLHLLRGRPLAAARHNVLVAAGAPVAVGAGVAWATDPHRLASPVTGRRLRGLALLMLAFGLVRNLPVPGLRRLRP